MSVQKVKLGIYLVSFLMLGLCACSQKEKRILVFSKTMGFRHASIEPGKVALLKMGEEMGIKVDTTENSAFFTEDTLKNYSAVVFLNTTGNVLDHIQQADFERYIQAGGGYVGIHAATDTEYDWPWYNKLAGALFNGHPGNPNVREGEITTLDHAHPATKDLPENWKKVDEFYDFKSFNEKVRVLMTVDEESYGNVGKHGDYHPITWYHDYDGGRAFYTNFGHTDETFQEEEFLKILKGGLEYAIGDNHLDYSKAKSLRVPEENRFVKAVFASNLDEPMELDFLSEDKILFIERKGGIKLYNIATDELKLLTTMDVFTKYEDGLLGLAVDPKFEYNNFIYLFYSPVGDESVQHISRFAMLGDSLLMNTEKVILKVPVQREQCCHSAGSLQFGPDGNLFIALGDDTSPFNSEQTYDTDGYAPLDEREGRYPFDAQKSAGNLNDLRGAILRIKPNRDGSYEIPEGNLFPEGTEGVRAELFVKGCRNPYRISVDSERGWLFWGDIGPDAGNDKEERGPKGHDEFNLAKTPGYYGWPFFVADNKPYRKMDYTTGKSGQLFDPMRPVNTSPNNTGPEVLPPARPALIYYPYTETKEFPHMVKGGRNAMAGPVYYYDKFRGSKNRLPEYYNGKVFHYDWMRNWIHAVTLDEEGNYVKQEPFLPNMKFEQVIDMEMGPDGAIYVLEYGKNWFAQNPEAVLARIDYAEGNRIPTARISAEGLIGSAPHEVKFSGEQSFDFDEEDALTYEWFFDGSEAVQSTEANPVFTYQEAGIYQARLRVTDKGGAISEAEIEVKVGNAMPQIAIDFVSNETFYWSGMNKNYEVKVTDEEDGTPAEKDVQVFFDYMAMGKDLTIIAQGHQQKTALLDGGKLIDENGCKSCHAMQDASVGPSYENVAKRYETNDETVAQLASKVINGGNGVWGERMMSAHPQLSTDEAEAMIRYVLSLDEEEVKPSLPLSGELVFNENVSNESYYLFTVNYTDQGGDVVGPLTSSKVLKLRNPKVEGESYDKHHDVRKRRPGGADYTLLYKINPGSWFMYDAIDLTGVNKLTLSVGSTTPGYSVTLRNGAPDGEILGKTEVPYTSGDYTDMSEVQLDIQRPIIGLQDVYFVFEHESAEPAGFVTLDWVFFHPSSEATVAMQ